MTLTAPLPFDTIAEARRQWIPHGCGYATEAMAAVTSVMRAQQLMLSQVEAARTPHTNCHSPVMRCSHC